MTTGIIAFYATGSIPKRPGNAGSISGGGMRQQLRDKLQMDPRKRLQKVKDKYDPRKQMKNLKQQLDPKNLAKAGAKQLVDEAKKAAIKAAIMNPEITIPVLLILLFVLFFVFILTTGGSAGSYNQNQTQSPLQVTKTGPAQANVGDKLQYSINVTYPGSATDVVISDPLPQGTTYVSSNPSGQLTTTGNAGPGKSPPTITWDAKTLKLPLANPINITISLTLQATKNNNNIGNVATVTLDGGSLSASGGTGGANTAYVPPSTDNCGGKYSTDMEDNALLKKNFGDPDCNFSKDQLYTQLKQEDPKDAAVFYTIIVPCESSYDPDIWVPPAPGLDPQGPWGLFQMGSSKPPGLPPPAPGENGVNDRGDVNWQVQIINATTTGKSEPSLESTQGGYWSSDDWARC
jgi:uncharacterized repeat protein (TIGR01451 family)